MVRAKKGTHGSESTWCAWVGQNGADPMVRAKKGTHGSEWTWCDGVSQNGTDLMVGEKRERTDQNGLGVLGSVGMELITW